MFSGVIDIHRASRRQGVMDIFVRYYAQNFP